MMGEESKKSSGSGSAVDNDERCAEGKDEGEGESKIAEERPAVPGSSSVNNDASFRFGSTVDNDESQKDVRGRISKG